MEEWIVAAARTFLHEVVLEDVNASFANSGLAMTLLGAVSLRRLVGSCLLGLDVRVDLIQGLPLGPRLALALLEYISDAFV